MNIRPILTVLSATTILTFTACGPTKTGLEARSQARDRINSYTARFTFDQARQDFRAGQFDRALREIDAAIAESPEDPEYHLLRGRIFLETNRLDDAIGAFASAIECHPDFADPHYYSGIVFQRWSDDEQALGHYARAFELDPANVQYLLATAESYIALGEFQAAREWIESRLTYFEHNPAMRHLLGQIALLEGDAVTAARCYEEAMLLDADDNSLLEELAWAQYDARQYAACYESVTLLQSRLNEPRLDLRHLEARCLTMLDRSADAHNLYTQLIQTNPSNQSLWIELGTLAWKLGDYRRVAECSVRTIDLAPNRYEGYMLKGLYERNRGNMTQAVALLRQAADRSVDSVLPYLLLGRTLEQAGRAEEALTTYAKALEIDPKSRDAQALYTALAGRMHVAAVENE